MHCSGNSWLEIGAHEGEPPDDDAERDSTVRHYSIYGDAVELQSSIGWIAPGLLLGGGQEGGREGAGREQEGSREGSGMGQEGALVGQGAGREQGGSNERGGSREGARSEQGVSREGAGSRVRAGREQGWSFVAELGVSNAQKLVAVTGL